jgi:hypothetical protein
MHDAHKMIAYRADHVSVRMFQLQNTGRTLMKFGMDIITLEATQKRHTF